MNSASSSSHSTISSRVVETTSQYEFEELIFLWNLDIFEFRNSSQPFYKLESPMFQGGEKCQHSWQLHWEQQEETDDFGKLANFWFTIKLVLVDMGKSDFAEHHNSGMMQARAVLSFVNSKTKKLMVISQDPDDPSEMSLRNVKAGDILKTVDGDGYALYECKKDKNMVQIHCRILVRCGTKHVTTTKNILFPFEKGNNDASERFNCLSQAMNLALHSPEFTDVNVVTPTRSFRAHKAILAARSPVFAAMFRTKMLETKDNSVDIADFEEDVVEAMLEYMYCGKISKQLDNQMDLLRIADKYELLELTKECEQSIASNLTIENAAEVFVVATLLNLNDLKSFVGNFIHKNKQEIIKTMSFKKFAKQNSSIILDLYTSI